MSGSMPPKQSIAKRQKKEDVVVDEVFGDGCIGEDGAIRASACVAIEFEEFGGAHRVESGICCWCAMAQVGRVDGDTVDVDIDLAMGLSFNWQTSEFDFDIDHLIFYESCYFFQ